MLIQTLQDQLPRLAALAAIEHTQMILDRVLFIAFAESTSLLPDKLIQKAWDQKSPFWPNGAWENFVGLFDAVDRGNPALDIPAYNGVLFARNAIIDDLGLPYYVCENFDKIASYDFASEVSVTVLGHIFDNRFPISKRSARKCKGRNRQRRPSANAMASSMRRISSRVLLSRRPSARRLRTLRCRVVSPPASAILNSSAICGPRRGPSDWCQSPSFAGDYAMTLA